jgi:hypothetical protein
MNVISLKAKLIFERQRNIFLIFFDFTKQWNNWISGEGLPAQNDFEL